MTAAHVERPTRMKDGQTYCSCGSPWPCSRVVAVYPHARAEWLRWWVGYVLATPFYAVAGIGEAAERVGRCIVTWSERASDDGEGGASYACCRAKAEGVPAEIANRGECTWPDTDCWTNGPAGSGPPA